METTACKCLKTIIIPGLQVLGEILILAGFFRFWRKKLDKLTIHSYNVANLR